jgi:hypothetical protein
MTLYQIHMTVRGQCHEMDISLPIYESTLMYADNWNSLCPSALTQHGQNTELHSTETQCIFEHHLKIPSGQIGT